MAGTGRVMIPPPASTPPPLALVPAVPRPPHLSRGEDPNKLLVLESVIAEGSYGTVYKGKHSITNVDMAIKIVSLDEESTLEEVQIEVDILNKCTHPNICGYYGSWVWENELFIALELCEGPSATDFVIEHILQFSESIIALITRETLLGLNYLHRLGFIHRDIKGANILLTRQGGVKLVDFGICSHISEKTPSRTTFIGTPYWMAPEVIANRLRHSPYTTKADVWSLGITLFELSEGAPPLAQHHPMKALLMIPYRDPPKFANPSQWSSHFNNFLSRCVVREPAGRASVDELLKHPFVCENVATSDVLAALISRFIDEMAKKEQKGETEVDLNEAEQEEDTSVITSQQGKKGAQPQVQPALTPQLAQNPAPPSVSPPSLSPSPPSIIVLPSLPLDIPPPPSNPAPLPPTAAPSSASKNVSSTVPSSPTPLANSPAPPPGSLSPAPRDPASSLESHPTSTAQYRRPSNVYKTVEKRVASIKEQINRKLVKQQLVQIKQLQKEQHSELDSLSSRQAAEKTRLQKFYEDKIQREQRRRQQEVEQFKRRVQSETDMEEKRFKAEADALQRQLVGNLRTTQKEQANVVKQKERELLAQFSAEEKTFKDNQRKKDKSRGNKEYNKCLEVFNKLEALMFTHHVEEAVFDFQKQQELERLRYEQKAMIEIQGKLDQQKSDQLWLHLKSEQQDLVQEHALSLDTLTESNSLLLESLVKKQTQDQEYLEQTQQLIVSQLMATQALERDQTNKRQEFEAKEIQKDLRLRIKKMTMQFNSTIAAEEKSKRNMDSLARKQWKKELAQRKEDHTNACERQQASVLEEHKRSVEEEDLFIANNQRELMAHICEMQRKELQDLIQTHSAAKMKMEEDHRIAREEMIVAHCRKLRFLLKAQQEAQYQQRQQACDQRRTMLTQQHEQQIMSLQESNVRMVVMVTEHQNAQLPLISEVNKLLAKAKESSPIIELRNKMLQVQETQRQTLKNMVKAQDEREAALTSEHVKELEAEASTAGTELASLQQNQIKASVSQLENLRSVLKENNIVAAMD
ncbi:STE/STE20 protein kinase [Pelomyxa schiedti]|nr:STE/STE20 protein kinase [Pelomyxa schiedti]